MLPPVILLDTLSRNVRRPSLEELRSLFNMRHLVRCVEYLFLQYYIPLDPENWHWNSELLPRKWRATPSSMPASEILEYPRLSHHWGLNFHTAVFRVLIAGPVFARAYQEPFFSARSHGHHDFLPEYNRLFLDARQEDLYIGHEGEGEVIISEKEKEILRTFPVYDLQAYSKSEPTFAPFVDWLLEDIKKQTAADIDHIQSGDTSDPILHQVGMFLFAFSWLDNMDGMTPFINEDKKFGWGRTKEDDSPIPLEELQGNIRTVYLVLFGIFQCEEFKIPTAIENVAKTHIVVSQLPQAINTVPITDIENILARLSDSPD